MHWPQWQKCSRHVLSGQPEVNSQIVKGVLEAALRTALAKRKRLKHQNASEQ